MFIFKKFEEKAVLETSLLHRAAHTAVYNNFRKKGRQAQELFERKRNWKRISQDAKREYEDMLRNVREADKKDGSWRDKIMKANRLKK